MAQRAFLPVALGQECHPRAQSHSCASAVCISHMHASAHHSQQGGVQLKEKMPQCMDTQNPAWQKALQSCLGSCHSHYHQAALYSHCFCSCSKVMGMHRLLTSSMRAVPAHLMPCQHVQHFVLGWYCSWTAALGMISLWPDQHCACQGRRWIILGWVQPSAQQQPRLLRLQEPSAAQRRLSQSPVWAAHQCLRAGRARRLGRGAPARPCCPAAQPARHAHGRPARPPAHARWALL